MSTANTRGRISPEWADRVSTNHFDIWRYNRTQTETIGSIVALRNLGSLVVRWSDELYEPDEAIEVGRRRSLANLSFGEVGRITLTEWLLEAALLRGGETDPLARDLQTFGVELGRPAWLIPAPAIEALEPVVPAA
jgi:hypothetical protein